MKGLKFGLLAIVGMMLMASCVMADPPTSPSDSAVDQHYVGVAKITARPINDPVKGDAFRVTYATGEVSVVGRATFERTFLRLDPDGLIDQCVVDSVTVDTNAMQVGNRTMIATASTTFGHEAFGKASCAETYAFDPSQAKKIATARAKAELWENLGFVLQWANEGLTNCCGKDGCDYEPCECTAEKCKDGACHAPLNNDLSESI